VPGDPERAAPEGVRTTPAGEDERRDPEEAPLEVARGVVPDRLLRTLPDRFDVLLAGRVSPLADSAAQADRNPKTARTVQA